MEGRRGFVCHNCGFVNKVEPEHNLAQEKRFKSFSEEYKVKLAEYDKACARHKEIERKCDEVNRGWRRLSDWKKYFINEINRGATFRRFLAHYPEITRLKEKGLVEYSGSYVLINHDNLPYPAYPFPNLSAIPKDWNYSYTCENCGVVNTYWKPIKQGGKNG